MVGAWVSVHGYIGGGDLEGGGQVGLVQLLVFMFELYSPCTQLFMSFTCMMEKYSQSPFFLLVCHPTTRPYE